MGHPANMASALAYSEYSWRLYLGRLRL